MGGDDSLALRGPRSYGSLRAKILVPLGLLVAGGFGVQAWFVTHRFSRELEQLALHRTEIVLRELKLDLSRAADLPALQALVEEASRSDDVADILVAAGQPRRVLAATESSWLGYLPADLPDEAAARELVELSQAEGEGLTRIRSAKTYTLAAPIVSDLFLQLGGANLEGLAVVRLDLGRIHAAASRHAWLDIRLWAAVLVGLSTLAYLLFDAHVLRAIRKLRRAVEARAAGDTGAYAALGTRDELGQLGRRFDQLFDALDLSHRENEQLALVARYTDRAVLLLDREGAIEWANPGFTDLTGHALAAVRRRSPAEVLFGPETSQLDAHGFYQALESGGALTSELLAYKADGSTLWISVSLRRLPETTDHRARTLFVFGDITRRVDAERRHREGRRQLHDLADGLPGAVFQIVFHPSGRRAHCPFVSEGARKLTGLSPERLRESPAEFFARVLPEDWPDLELSLRRAGRRLRPWSHEFRIRAASGRLVWLRGFARPVRVADGQAGWNGLLLDLTDQKLAEEARLQSETRHRMLMETANDAIFVVDASSGDILESNHKAQEWIRLSSGAIRPRRLVDLLTEEKREPTRRALERAAARGLSVTETTELVGRGGAPLVAEVSASVVDLNGRRALYAIFRDVTERARAEEETRRALARERELNEMKSRFISTVSHEFRTPLTSITLSAGMLRDFGARLAPADREKHFTFIQEGTRQMTLLLEDVLLLNRAEASALPFDPRPLALGEFCRELCERASAASPAHEIALRLGEEADVTLEADEKLLRLVLANLLSNAVKFSPRSSRVEFRVEREGDGLTFAVADNGIGIPAADRPHIFATFRRAANTGALPGTGLGLSIARHAARRQGGDLSFTSEEGRGTTFVFRLPRALLTAAPAALHAGARS